MTRSDKYRTFGLIVFCVVGSAITVPMLRSHYREREAAREEEKKEHHKACNDECRELGMIPLSYDHFRGTCMCFVESERRSVCIWKCGDLGR